MKPIFKYFAMALCMLLLVSVTINISLYWGAYGRTYSSVNNIPHRTYGMVLGTVKHDDYGGIFQFYLDRIKATAELYHAGKIDTVLVSSNNYRRYYYNATTIKNDLVEQGVPPGRILVDTLGLRTYNSVVRCRDVYAIDSVTIITQQWHGERALFIASNCRVDAILYPAAGKYRLAKLEAVYHELAAQFLMFWDLLQDKIK